MQYIRGILEVYFYIKIFCKGNQKIQHVRQVSFVKLVEKMYLDLKFHLLTL